jgi:hypothetical protein
MPKFANPKQQSRLGRFFRKLRRSQSGVAMIEFAYALPIFTGVGMYGIETAYYAVTTMKVSQAALNLADNASRMGQTLLGSASPTIRESGVIDIMAGLRLQTEAIDLLDNGRVVLTSLEVMPDGQQFIHWQRCKGFYDKVPNTPDSKYNDDKEDDGEIDDTFVGMGSSGQQVQAIAGSAVMFVEIEFQYQPLFNNLFLGNRVIRQEAAFNIRDDRNLGAGLNNDIDSDSNVDPATDATSNAASCLKYDAT